MHLDILGFLGTDSPASSVVFLLAGWRANMLMMLCCPLDLELLSLLGDAALPSSVPECLEAGFCSPVTPVDDEHVPDDEPAPEEDASAGGSEELPEEETPSGAVFLGELL